MNKFFLFKVTFLSTAAGIFAGCLVYGLFDVDFSNSESVIKWLLKSLAIAIGTGLIFGILNAIFKFEVFKKKGK